MQLIVRRYQASCMGHACGNSAGTQLVLCTKKPVYECVDVQL
jgi:hypothetical protein